MSWPTWESLLPSLERLARDSGLSVAEAERHVRGVWGQIRSAVATATFGALTVPDLPSSLPLVAQVADRMLGGEAPRAAGFAEEAHAVSLLFFADAAEELGPKGYDIAGFGVLLLTGGGGGGGATAVAGVVGGAATAPTGAGPVVGAIATVLGVLTAVASVLVAVGAIVVGLWARVAWSAGMPAKWRAEAAEITRGKREKLQYTLLPGPQVLVGLEPAEPSTEGEAKDGLDVGELVAIAGLLWAVFGR